MRPPDITAFCPWLRAFIGELYDRAPDDRLRVAVSADRWRGLRAYAVAERKYREEMHAHQLEFSSWLRGQASTEGLASSISDNIAIKVAMPVPPLPPETPERGSFLGVLLGHELFFEALP